MSTTTDPRTNGHHRKLDGVRTYRGRKLEELIPKIRAELGPDAIILRQREGLMGGVAGFFAQRCVEVEAQAGPRIDLYDDEQEDGTAGPQRAPSPVPAPTEPSFAAQLHAASAQAPAAAAAPAEASGAPIVHELAARGISERWARQLIATARAHQGLLADGGDLRQAVRAAITASIPTAVPLPASGAAIALVGAGGAGKTRLAAALAAAYRRAGTLSPSVVVLGRAERGAEIEDLLRRRGQLTELLRGQDVRVTAAAPGRGAVRAVSRGRDGGLIIVDTGAAAPGDALEVRARASELKPLRLDATHLLVPATLSASAARKLVEGLAPLQPTAIAVTHADQSDQLGAAVELAYAAGLPIACIHDGRTPSATSPFELAARLLP